MNENINLISNQNVALEKELRRLKRFRLISIVCLVVVLAASILIFVLNFTLPLDSVKKEQTATASNISLLHKKLVTYTLITDRVKNISNIISQRGNYIPQVNDILGKVPTDVSVDGLGIDPGKITISISSTSLISINKFIDDMVSLGTQGKVIKDIVIQGLSLDVGNNKYVLNMKASLP
jgi:competence protein ComGC